MVKIDKNTLKQLFSTNNIVLIFAIFVSASLVWNTAKVIDGNFALQKKVDVLEDEIALLDLQGKNLLLDNEYHKTDEYLELAARDKLGKVAAGEKVLILPDRDRSWDPLESNDSTNKSTSSNFDQWMYFLFGREPS